MDNKKSISGLVAWLKGLGLEKYLVGGSFVNLISWQISYYSIFLGKQFEDIDWDNVFIDSDRLNLISRGLKEGLINYVLLKYTPSKLATDDKNLSEAEYFYFNLFRPLVVGQMSVFGNLVRPLSSSSSGSLFAKLSEPDCVKNYLPVSLEDFNPKEFSAEPNEEIRRVALSKKVAPRVTPGKVELIFTNCSLEAPAGRQILNQQGEMVEVDGSFASLITKQIKILDPAAAIILLSQLYYNDRIISNQHFREWLMAIVYNPDAPSHRQISAAGASINSGITWSSYAPQLDGRGNRFRLAL
ncbi:MAG: hypothetical protein WC523_02095 [Patescibacteria group bacterium]|jgi:hypothetical protein